MSEVEDTAERRVRNSLDIERRVVAVLRKLKADRGLRRLVDSTLDVPEVFHGKGEIRLIVLGQDPTVKNPASRRLIKTTLNLDKEGTLRDYLRGVCEGLGLDLDRHVYATNYLKNFFVNPPTQMETDVFQVFGPKWLPLLQDELAQFPRVPVITLGQPLLGALVLRNASSSVRDYWGYTPLWKSGERGPFRHLAAEHNGLGRTVFPFPHQPSITKRFYAERIADYTAFVKQEALSR